MTTSEPPTEPITIAALAAFLEALMLDAAPLFVILVPLPITDPTSAPKDVTSPVIFTSALTRQLSRVLLPATVLNITPEFIPDALKTAPFEIVTATLLNFTFIALPSTADEISVFEINSTFLTDPHTSEKIGAEIITL